MLAAPTREPLRGVAWRPDGALALVVGDNGAIVTYDGICRTTSVLTPVNLRRVAFHPSGRYALIAGNDGLVVRWQDGRTRAVGWGHRHLRGIAWRPDGALALFPANGGLYRYYDGGEDLEHVDDLIDGDLVACAWSGDGDAAVAVGYVQDAPDSESRQPVIWALNAEGVVQDRLLLNEVNRGFVSVDWRSTGEWWIVDQPTDRFGPSHLAQFAGGELTPKLQVSDTKLVQITWHPAGDEALVLAARRAAFWRT